MLNKNSVILTLDVHKSWNKLVSLQLYFLQIKPKKDFFINMIQKLVKTFIF